MSDIPGPELSEAHGLQAVINHRGEHGKTGECPVRQSRKIQQKCRFINLAYNALSVFEESEEKTILKNLTKFSIERNF